MTALPSTDRPLTAGDVALLREGDVLRFMSGLADGLFVSFSEGLIAWQKAPREMVRHNKPAAFTFVSRPAPVPEAGEGVARLDREALAREVRIAWVQWAETQPDPKASWLVSYDGLSEPDKEADRQIGEHIQAVVLSNLRSRASMLVSRSVAWSGDGQYEPTEAMFEAGLETCRPGNQANMIASFKAMMQQAELDGLIYHPAPADRVAELEAALREASVALSKIVQGDIHHEGFNLDTDEHIPAGSVSRTWVGPLGRIAKTARKEIDRALLSAQPRAKGEG